MHTLSSIADAGLARKAQNGDAEAFAELYRRHSRAVYRFAMQMSNNPALADEVTQEVFLKLLRKELIFDEVRGALELFLLGVARNVLRRLFRTPAVEDFGEHQEPATPEPDALEDLTRREALEGLRQAIQSLPENYRETVVLCELQEMTYEQAAGVLHCPVGTVRSRLARARGLLASKLASGAQKPGNTSRCVA